MEVFDGPEDIHWAKAAPGGAPRGHNPPVRAQVGCAHLSGLPHTLFTL